MVPASLPRLSPNTSTEYPIRRRWIACDQTKLKPSPRYPGFIPAIELSSRPERSVVEGPVVSVPLTSTSDYNRPTLCHLDRSVAQWRDLRFYSPNLCFGLQPPYPLSSRPKRTRISYFALLATTTDAVFPQEKPHDVDRRNESRQEIRGSAVERSAVISPLVASLIQPRTPVVVLPRLPCIPPD